MGFGETASKLARNPLGLVALFLVLIYGIAGLFLKFAGETLSVDQKWPFVWFMVLFPLAVLGVFAWLVARHSTKLYAPSDFKTEDGYFRSLSISPSSSVKCVNGKAAEPELIQGRAFGSEEVSLDGKRYVKCSFRGSTLVFKGYNPVSFSETAFLDVNWKLDGPAALTIDFLTGLYRSSDIGRNLVENTVNRIRGDHKEETN